MRVHALPLAALLVLAGGCAAAAPVTPVEVTAAHLAAARRLDLQAAASLLEPVERARGREWPAPPPRLRSDVAPVEVGREASWRLPDSGALVLWRDAAGYQIRAGVLGLTRASTPRQALSTLARAITARDYGLLLSLLPASERARWSSERLAQALELPEVRAAWEQLALDLVAVDPEPAWLDEGTHLWVQARDVVVYLGREDDGWKILDLRPPARFTPPPP